MKEKKPNFGERMKALREEKVNNPKSLEYELVNKPKPESPLDRVINKLHDRPK